MPWLRDSSGLSTVSAHGCRAAASAYTSVTNSTETVLAFGSESDDTDGYHDTVTNNSRITVPSGLAGVYSISGLVQFAVSSTGQRYCRLKVNGTPSDFGQTAQGIATLGTHVVLSQQRRLAVGDYIELIAFQNSGGALNAIGFLHAYLIGA